MSVTWTITPTDANFLVEEGAPFSFRVEVGTTGRDGPNLIADSTSVGDLTEDQAAAFLIVASETADAARKLTPTVWGLNTLLATVPAGRVPFADTLGGPTSVAGLTYNAATSTLTIGTGNSSLVGAGRAVTFASNGIFIGHANLQGYGDIVLLKSTGGLGFSASGSLDQYSTETKIARISAGVLGVCNQADSTLRDFSVRNLTANTSVITGEVQATPELLFNIGGNRLTGVQSAGFIQGSARTYGWTSTAGPSGIARDTEMSRSSAGFVGLGSPTNKVTVGHNGTDGVFSSLSGRIRLYASNGVYTLRDTSSADAINFKLNNQCQLSMVSGGNIGFTNSATDGFNGVDTRIRRSSANVLDLDTGTNEAFADLRLRNLTLTRTANNTAAAENDLLTHTNPLSSGGSAFLIQRYVGGVGYRLHSNVSVGYGSLLNADAGVNVTGNLTVRQPLGTAGTDEIALSHNGTDATIRNNDTSGSVLITIGGVTYTFANNGQLTAGQLLMGSGGGVMFGAPHLLDTGMVRWSSSGTPGIAYPIGIARLDDNTLEVTNGVRTASGGALRGLNAARLTLIGNGVTNEGRLVLAGSAAAPTTPPFIDFANNSGGGINRIASLSNDSSNQNYIGLRPGLIDVLAAWRYDGSNQGVQIGAGAFTDASPNRATLGVVSPTNSTVPTVIIAGRTGQTTALTEWRRTIGEAAIASVSAGGGFTAAAYNGTNGSYALWTSSPNTHLLSNGATHVPLVIRGAVSQTGNLLELQNNGGTTVVGVTPAGRVFTTANAATLTLDGGSAGGGSPFVVIQGQGATRAEFGGSSGSQYGTRLTGTANSSYPVLIVQSGASGQTADVTQWQNSSGTVLASVSAGGGITTGRTLTDNPFNTFWGNHGNNPAIFVRATGGNGSNVGYGWLNNAGTQIVTLMTDPAGNNSTNLRLSLLSGSSFEMFVAGSQVASISAAGASMAVGGFFIDNALAGGILRDGSDGSTIVRSAYGANAGFAFRLPGNELVARISTAGNLTLTGPNITTPTSFAWGTNVDVNGGLQGVVIGHGTSPTATRGGGTGAVSIGRDCVTSGGVAIGNTVSTGGSDSTAVGRLISAGQNSGVALGGNITLGAANGIGIGRVVTTAGQCSAAIGFDITTTNAGEFAWGTREQNPSFSVSRFAGTPTTRKLFSIDGSWVDGGSVADASRTGRMTLGVFNTTTLQEGIRIDANSGGVRLGFYGATAVARQTVAADATDLASAIALINDLKAKLAALGLVQ